MPQPDGSRLEIFGSGGGEIVSASLSETLGYEVPLLAQLPLDIRLREGSDTGCPAVVADDGKPAADAPAALELSAVAQRRDPPRPRPGGQEPGSHSGLIAGT